MPRHRPHLLLAPLLAAGLLAAPSSGRAAPAAPPPLQAVLDDLLLNGPLAEARAAACVVSLDTGATLYARDADALLNPASNVKLFTAAAVLARLGPEFRFETELSVDAASAGLPGGAARTLFVKGKGDPTLVTERLTALVADLHHLGLRKVGDLVLDEGWFDGVRIGPGFDQETGDRAYLAPAGALSLNYNTVAVHVGPGERPGAPGRVELEPDSGYLELVNRTTTVGPRAARRLIISSDAAPGGRQRILVEGRLPQGGRTSATWRRIEDPPRYLGESLKRLLEQRGIKVTGRVRLGAVPADARLLHVAESESLGEVVRRLQKTSNNFMAEQLVKALGAATAGPPGSWRTGIAAIEGFLAEVGLPRGAYVMKNGSGLNDANRFSARQTVQLLAAMWRRFPLSAEYLASLPVAGRDGTIRGRMEGSAAEGQVRAKTGTLDGVVALSGYVETAAQERLAFAILVNDHGRRNGAVTRAVDQVAATLAARGRPADQLATGPLPSSRAGRVGAPPSPGAAPPAGLDVTLRTYLAMGRTADRRNAAFLRTALQAEAEPSVRLAVAEALYRSDPDSGAAQRGVLESVAASLSAAPAEQPSGVQGKAAAGAHAVPRQADAAPLVPLLAVAEPGDHLPVLAALGDLAAEPGGALAAEALGWLLDLAPASAGQPAVRGALTTVLQDLAEAIPAELTAAALAAPAPVRAAAADLLGERLPALRPSTEAPATIGPPTTP